MTRTITRVLWLAARRWKVRRDDAEHHSLQVHALTVRVKELEKEVRQLRTSMWKPPKVAFGPSRPRRDGPN